MSVPVGDHGTHGPAATNAAARIRPLQVIRGARNALAVVLGLHVLAFVTLFVIVIPGHYQVGGKVFGIGLAST